MYKPFVVANDEFRSTWRTLVLAVALLGPSCALAQNKLTIAPDRVVVTVTPAVAGPNVARTITINGLWREACVPGNPTLENDTGTSTLLFKVYVPQTLVACAQAITPFQAEQ